MSSRSIRLSLRERAWLPLEFIRTVGPVSGVDAAGLVAALTGLHAADPTHRAVCRLDRDKGRWVPMGAAAFAAYAGEAVTAVDGPDVTAEMLSARLMAEPRAHHPVRVLVGNGYVALKVAHAYGDADPVNRLLRELVKAAAEGRAAVLPRVAVRRQLTRALINQFGRYPKRWRDGLRIDREPAVRPLGPEDSVPWQADIACESTHSLEVMDKMRAWRDEHAPGVSTSAITYAAFIGALRHCGLGGRQEGAMFLADARRYLPKKISTVDGNFCWGQYLAPVDLTDPRAIQSAQKAELRTGRILTMMALREIRLGMSAVQGMPEPYPTSASRDRRQNLTLGNQGRHDLLADLPWSAPAEDRVNHSIPTHIDAHDITLCTSEMAGVLHVDITYHRSSYDQATMARVAELICTEPVAMIMAMR